MSNERGEFAGNWLEIWSKKALERAVAQWYTYAVAELGLGQTSNENRRT
jgi:hypothetical protein